VASAAVPVEGKRGWTSFTLLVGRCPRKRSRPAKGPGFAGMGPLEPSCLLADLHCPASAQLASAGHLMEACTMMEYSPSFLAAGAAFLCQPLPKPVPCLACAQLQSVRHLQANHPRRVKTTVGRASSSQLPSPTGHRAQPHCLGRLLHRQECRQRNQGAPGKCPGWTAPALHLMDPSVGLPAELARGVRHLAALHSLWRGLAPVGSLFHKRGLAL
jgi:hypothetical protein